MKQMIWLFLTATLVSISPFTHAVELPRRDFSAEHIQNEVKTEKSKEVDYLGRELTVPPRIELLEHTHPITHGLTGKALYFNFATLPSITVIRFNSDESMTWWDTSTPEKSYTASYVVFEIAKNIYYLNWAENKAYGLPWEGAWLAAIVVDLNKMVATDTYVSPTERGKARYGISQIKITLEDIDNAKGDKRYVPREFAVN